MDWIKTKLGLSLMVGGVVVMAVMNLFSFEESRFIPIEKVQEAVEKKAPFNRGLKGGGDALIKVVNVEIEDGRVVSTFHYESDMNDFVMKGKVASEVRVRDGKLFIAEAVVNELMIDDYLMHSTEKKYELEFVVDGYIEIVKGVTKSLVGKMIEKVQVYDLSEVDWITSVSAGKAKVKENGIEVILSARWLVKVIVLALMLSGVLMVFSFILAPSKKETYL